MSETVFTYAAPALKFGIGRQRRGRPRPRGVRRPAGAAGHRRRASRPPVTPTGSPSRCGRTGIEVVIFAEARVEPTDESMDEAIAFARDAESTGAVRRGPRGRRRLVDRHRQGGQPAAHQPGRADGLHQRAGRQGPARPSTRCCRWSRCRPRPAPAARAPPSACSTCSSLHVKTGHQPRRAAAAAGDRRPGADAHASPTMVTAAAGMDILCHALESYTARWYADFDAKQPEQRVPYCGANPIADLWSEKALTPAGRRLPERRCDDGADTVAREQMAMAATFAGLGFGNAGVHIPHANAYPIAGRVRVLRPRRLPGGRADRAARHGGLADRARGVPLHLRRRARSGTCARPGCSTPTPTGDGPDVLPRRPHRADARHRHPQRPGRGRLRRRRRRRPGRRRRSSSSGCWPRHRRRPRRRTSPRIFGASMEHW